MLAGTLAASAAFGFAGTALAVDAPQTVSNPNSIDASSMSLLVGANGTPLYSEKDLNSRTGKVLQGGSYQVVDTDGASWVKVGAGWVNLLNGDVKLVHG
ncbi:hypothetical protein ABT187_47715 [Streptomyces sp. NPDC001817]|uniref:hypothetical protein n=1 Tax=Streptomyces sp. NPDC001817 TaxID=3154398 RepID=UPI003334A77B